MTRKELMKMMPVDAMDAAAAERVERLGFPTVAPGLRDMVQAMRVARSPAADVFAAFLARLGAPALPAIAKGLHRENGWLRHRIFTQVLPQWPVEAIQPLKIELACIATQPDEHDNDLLCMELLLRHHLVETAWLAQWLEFKKERWTVRAKALRRVEEKLRADRSGG